jgi:tRNA threonylcarbamoyladenosine biosynthesis protein TsaB
VKILALDTATENCSVALWVDGRVTALELLLERGHAERLLPMVDELLGASSVPLGTLTAIAFGRGPGAFTGLRLAASVAQGLAYGARLSVVPVSDLQALAERVLAEGQTAHRVIVCTDARLGEVYWACFERSAEGRAAAVTSERVSRPEAVSLPDAWRNQGSDLVGAGSGFRAYPQLRSAVGAALDAIQDGLLPRAREVAALAAPEVAAGRVLPPEEALPVYLRDDVVHPSPARSLN